MDSKPNLKIQMHPHKLSWNFRYQTRGRRQRRDCVWLGLLVFGVTYACHCLRSGTDGWDRQSRTEDPKPTNYYVFNTWIVYFSVFL